MNNLWKTLEGTQFTYKYYLKKILGVGGFGAVFCADEVMDDIVFREVAVKVMQLDPDNKKRQIEELMISTQVKHYALLDCITSEHTQIAGVEYWGLVMELAQGSLLNSLKKETLNNTEIENLVKQIAEGLKYLHGKGIVHRDVKPANILSVNNDWKLGDFGITRMLDIQKNMTATSTQMGTKTYMPPEAYDGEVYLAWDCWSLGVVIVEAFTGNFAFGNFTTEAQLMKKVLNEEPSIPDSLSPPLQQVVKGCLIKDPKQRWSAQQILEALTPFVRPPELVLPEITKSPSTYQERLPHGIILELMNIPTGSFIMGSIKGDSREKPQHQVTINKSFYLGKYPITQEQYQAVMKTNPSGFKEDGKLPVEQVSWQEAMRFCLKLSQITNKKYRLPSEVEWEYTCRAGTTGRFYFGKRNLEDYTWFGGNSHRRTHRVGQQLPNQWGLYDMCGNVWEWCLDPWHDNYKGAPNDQRVWDEESLYEEQNISELLNDSKMRVLRGGSCFSSIHHLHSAFRCANNPDYLINTAGFRVVLMQ